MEFELLFVSVYTDHLPLIGDGENWQYSPVKPFRQKHLYELTDKAQL